MNYLHQIRIKSVQNRYAGAVIRRTVFRSSIMFSLYLYFRIAALATTLSPSQAQVADRAHQRVTGAMSHFCTYDWVASNRRNVNIATHKLEVGLMPISVEGFRMMLDPSSYKPYRSEAYAIPESPGFLRLIRCIDLAVALIAIVVFFPLMLTIALATKLFDNGPVIFAHSRMGKHGHTFGCLKFRSMVVDADQRLRQHLQTHPAAAAEWARDHKLRNDPRITPLGRFLRKSSLDELPQLFNVLRGDMSLVGPRPIVAAEVERYGRYFSSYCSVRPGITGLWQVSGRNDVTYRRRVALDVTYSRTQSLQLYLWIIFRTVPTLLERRGVY